MTASRLMIFASANRANHLLVWDWRVGDIVRAIYIQSVPILIAPPALQVLKCSSTRYNLLSRLSSKLVFIDEFRLLATRGVPPVSWYAPPVYLREFSLVMFDTSIPQQDKPAYRPTVGWERWREEAFVHTDSDRTQGEGSCDGPLVIDPTQSVVVLALNGHRTFITREAFLVIRTTALVGYMPSIHTCRHILWDEWKRDVMVVKALPGASHIRASVIGTRVLLITRNWEDNGGSSRVQAYRIQAYDFSRWGCRALVRVIGHGERVLMPTPKKIWFPREHTDGVRNMRVLGDSIVSCGVSDSLEP